METKRCTQCREEKSVADFYRRSGHTARLRSECRECSAKQRQIHGAQFAASHPRRIMLKLARQRARAAGVPFDLREDDFEIPATCPVLGIELRPGRGRRGPNDASPTLDRIILSLGYVPGNVVVMSWRANRIKSDASASELLRIGAWFQQRDAAVSRSR